MQLFYLLHLQVSDDAKDLVSKLLVVDPAKRYTCQQASMAVCDAFPAYKPAPCRFAASCRFLPGAFPHERRWPGLTMQVLEHPWMGEADGARQLERTRRRMQQEVSLARRCDVALLPTIPPEGQPFLTPSMWA
jgi:hypothetical protein